MKKLLTIVFALMLAIFACVSCGDGESKKEKVGEVEILPALTLEEPDYSGITIPETFKIGVICLHDETSTYDKNFIDAVKRALVDLKMNADTQLLLKVNVKENADCTEAANKLVTEGCNLIFADSFGHEKFLKETAEKNPNVVFCHATGTNAVSYGLDNFYNAFASIYEGRYLAGVAAGLKLKEMYGDKDGNVSDANAKIGYVGAYTYAEVISGYTSYYLGVKSIVPNVKMDVKFTGSWFDISREKSTAQSLIEGGCKIISQHADSMGAPSECEEKGVPNISYNVSTYESCSETFLISSAINWTPYFKHIITQTVKGERITQNYVGTLKTGSVILSKLNGDVAAEGTVAKLVEVRDKLVNGTLHVFDTANFTVNGQKVTTHNVAGLGEAVINGIFEESKLRSAPYFDLKIDGITLLNEEV